MRHEPREKRRLMRSDRRAGEHLLLAGTLLGTGLILVLTASLFVSGLGRFRGDDAAQAAAPTSAPVPTAPPPLAEPTPMASPTALPAAPATPVIAAGDAPLVCLDVGHGGIDWGNVRLSEDETEILTYEKDLVLAQSLDLEVRLKKRGIGVVLTRRTDSEVNAANQDINGDGEVGEDVNGDGRIDPEQGETVSNLDELQARVNMCNDAGADLLMSVHVNGAANTFLNGYETWWVKDRPISDQSRRF
ncbi:MAG: N-acetylmuramoyl-L-alanine amidase, partial [Chloroflexota bacterium]|nr:N-acetylmuramoyl-L-alanine amidase [Chloroflexota bacterium]